MVIFLEKQFVLDRPSLEFEGEPVFVFVKEFIAYCPLKPQTFVYPFDRRDIIHTVHEERQPI
jgi:hypothetical protein